MYCKYCKQEKDESKFPIVPGYNGAKYRSVRCDVCREEFLIEKATKASNKKKKNKNKTKVCKKCGKKFTIKFGTTGRPFVKCPTCRKKHVDEQNNSIKKIYKETIKKTNASLINNADNIKNSISKEEILKASAIELINRLFQEMK